MAEKAEKAETKAKKAKTPLTPEQKAKSKARRKAAKVIAFTSWRQDWRSENPEGTKDQRKDAWTKVQKDLVKKSARALKTLEKSGIALVVTPKAEKQAAEA